MQIGAPSMAVQSVDQPEELDLTGFHLHNLADVNVPPDLLVRICGCVSYQVRCQMATLTYCSSHL